MTRNYFVLVTTLLFLYACKKPIEVREVAKTYSWKEINRFTGTEKIFLSSGSDGKTIFLQQPFYFTTLKNQNEFSGITIYGAGMPTNVDARVPIAAAFTAYAVTDSVLRIINNSFPLITPSKQYYDLKKLDPTLTSIEETNSFLVKVMSINSNGTLLLSYRNSQVSQPLTFIMLKVVTMPSYPYVDTIFSKIVSIPRNITNGYAYTRYFTAIDDYFLADLGGNGIYKIKEDGSFQKVMNATTIDVFYKWQGKVYAYAEWDKLLISSDNGEGWQQYNGIPSSMTLSSYQYIKDSLIGLNRDNIYTLKWTDTHYSLRLLKNDGLEGSTINGLEILNDTIYAATTKGLFVKPVRAFFESK